MNSKQIDILNIGLIFLSLLLAFKLPFELFLFSYAVLGPLHYLTEINWLKDKNYFVSQRKWIWIFVVFSLLISIPQLVKLPLLESYSTTRPLKELVAFFKVHQHKLVFILLLFAIGLVYLKKTSHILLAFLVSIVAGILVLKYVSFALIIVAVFLPTLIHVYVFTFLFMLFGALASKSKPGIVAAVFLLACPLVILGANIDAASYVVSDYTKRSYDASSFNMLNSFIARAFEASPSGPFSLLSTLGIRIQVFIAFCYTYHYLNWFSKTTVIGWSRLLSKKKLTVILFIWAASIFLYWYDYKIGFTALFFLSMIHVVLEFPLNITSIKGIFSSIRLSSKKVSHR